MQKNKPKQTKHKQVPQKLGKNIRGKFKKKWRREGKVLHLWLEDERMNVKSGFKQRLRSQRLRKWKDSHLIHFSIKQYLREIITKSTCWEIHFITFHYHKIDQIGRDVQSSFSPAFGGKGSQEGIM